MATGDDWRVLIAGEVIKGATSTIAKAYIDKKIIPFIRGSVSTKTEAELKRNLSRYTRYLENRTRHLSTVIKTTSPLALEDVYEPLTISSKSTDFGMKVDSYPRPLFELGRCISITDDAGMGKSTLAKFIARSTLKESESIPIFIELRRLRLGTSIISSLCKELVNSGVDDEKGQELVGAFSNGRFIFILDGFDEVEESIRPGLVAEINDISARFQFCYFILTTRPEYSESLFPEFHKVSISKLTREQAHSIIKRIDAGRGLAKSLIQKISSAGIDEFLGNPLLVTLLYSAFDHRPTVPPKRSTFFRQVYDALFEDHDLSKGDAYERKKECNLDREDFHKLARALGFETFKKGRESYSESELSDLIKKAITRSELNADYKKVQRDFIKSVPIFIRDGTEIRWCHKSFQEYFASQYISHDTRDQRRTIIEKMFSSSEALKYGEIFRFMAESDANLLHDICTHPLLEKYKNASDKNYIPALFIHDAVDIFYLGTLGPTLTDQVSIHNQIKISTGIDIANRMTSAFVDWGNFAIVAALKERGPSYILLSAIDPKTFPPYKTTSKRNGATKAWRRTYGDDSLHINRDLNSLLFAIAELGSIDHIVEAACINSIDLEKIETLEQSRKERIAYRKETALDEF